MLTRANKINIPLNTTSSIIRNLRTRNISESVFTKICDEINKSNRSGIKKNSPYETSPMKVPKIPIVKIERKSVSPFVKLYSPIISPSINVPMKTLRNIDQIDCFTICFIKCNLTGLHMIRRVLSGSFGSANKTASAVCGKRQRANQPWGSGAATT